MEITIHSIRANGYKSHNKKLHSRCTDIGFTGILLQGLGGPVNAEQTKQLNMVKNSANHLLSLISDVLDISKIEAGQLTVACEPFDLSASLVKTTVIIRPLTERKGAGAAD